MRCLIRKLAEKYHAGQFRKGEGNIPYIVHPQAVAETLQKWSENSDSPAIMMAWGHDLLEDTCVSESEILAVSCEKVLQGIKLLTRPRDMDKALYLRSIVESGNRDALLVKISDRICNTNDFIKLEGKLYAYQYLHEADCLLPALENFSDDSMVKNALREWKNLDELLRNDAQHDAIRGCMLGGAVGDALGAPIEFMSKTVILQKYGKDGVQDYVEFADGTGAITDDTQMALFTAEGILRAYIRGHEKGICSPASVVKFAYQRWLKTQGYTPNVSEDFLNSGWLIKEKQLFSSRAPGMTCLSALEENNLHAKNNSKGCGTVMRLAPVGLFFDPESAYKYGCEFSAITHGHPTGITAGGSVCHAYIIFASRQISCSRIRFGGKTSEKYPGCRRNPCRYPQSQNRIHYFGIRRRLGGRRSVGNRHILCLTPPMEFQSGSVKSNQHHRRQRLHRMHCRSHSRCVEQRKRHPGKMA